MITIFAPDGIGEVVEGADLARLVIDAVAADPNGPLRAGDVVVITSKILSKAEGRRRPAPEREAAILDETAATVAWRGAMRIVRTRLGLVQAAAGVDSSNVSPTEILLLPQDPDASAEQLRARLSTAAGPVGVIVSDTAGRAWRIGQTDHAIGAAGVVVARSYSGVIDGHGNRLQVTLTAIADELAAAADLVKGKLRQRPVAVIRGVPDLVAAAVETSLGPRLGSGPTPRPDDADVHEQNWSGGAAELIRARAEDMFARGSREAVVAAVLAAVGRADAYDELVGLEGDGLIAAVVELCSPDDRDLAARVLRAAT